MRQILPALVLAPALAGAPLAAAQAPPPSGSVKAPAKIKRAALIKPGLSVTALCDAGCSGSVTLAGPSGVITSRSVTLDAGQSQTVRLRAKALQLEDLEKGAKLLVTLSQGGFMDPAIAQDSVRLK